MRAHQRRLPGIVTVGFQLQCAGTGSPARNARLDAAPPEQTGKRQAADAGADNGKVELAHAPLSFRPLAHRRHASRPRAATGTTSTILSPRTAIMRST